uniref:Uncharacterized protein n=1 Tax=Avena sativa TaxID=4498 RepID=A0ACD5WNA0_AVESA
MIKGRIKVRVVLLKQNIVNNDLCPFGCQDKETVQHFVFHCRHSKLILDKLGIQMNGYVEPEDIYIEANKRLLENKRQAWPLVITAIYWTIWLSRNKKVFDDIETPAEVVAKQCVYMVKLWSHRANKKEKEAALIWTSDWHS